MGRESSAMSGVAHLTRNQFFGEVELLGNQNAIAHRFVPEPSWPNSHAAQIPILHHHRRIAANHSFPQTDSPRATNRKSHATGAANV